MAPFPRTVRLLTAALLAAALLLLAGAALVGELLSRTARAPVGAAPQDLDAQAVGIDLAQGGTVRGWLVDAPNVRGVILLLHGVRGDRRQMLDRARFLRARGYASLLLDLPAHGESTGERITFGAREALGVEAALGYLCTRYARQPLGVLGASLGAAAYVLSTPPCRPRAVVLESMYPTIEEATDDRLRTYLGPLGPALAPALLWQLPWRAGVDAADLHPIERMERLGNPVLVAAGAEDRNTTLAETQRIYAAAHAPKELWIVSGAGHVDLHHFDPLAYEARVGAFLEQYLR